jgi:hypothetical protein
MQGKVILTNEEILDAVNHYHSDKVATEQRTSIQNANPERWKEYLSWQTKENQKLLTETKVYLDSLVAQKYIALKYLEINRASDQVITRMSKLLVYDADVAFAILESVHRRAISESGASELVESLATFYEKLNGIRPRIDGFLEYLANNVGITYNLNADKLREPLAKYVFTEEQVNTEMNRKLREISTPTPPPPAEGKDQGKSNYPAIVIMAVAQIIDNIEGKSFLPKEETNYKERVEKTKTAILDKLKITVGNSIGNHFNPLEKLTKSHRKKIVELLNIKDYTQQAKDFELKIIATNR